MTAAPGELRKPTAPPRSGLRPAASSARAARSGVVQLGEMVTLAGRVLYEAVRHPFGYWADVRDQMFAVLRLTWLPVAIATFAALFGAPGLQGGNLFWLFGVPERIGSFFLMASVREFAPWITAMVVAGVVGAAITADLGARRIREEIDALRVLGLDPVRSLVLPRVIAVTLMTGLLDLTGLTFGLIGGFVAAVPVFGATAGGFLASFFANATTVDLAGSLVKTTMFGFIVGIVCSYKGLNAKGGPVGVGRAVNQAVVIAFAVIWVVNFVFTTTLLGLSPETQVFR